MKFLYAITILTLLFSCGQRDEFAGLWKIRKVEIHKNNELKKVIDTGFQYWNFKKRSTISIFDKHKVQNTLRIRIRPGVITSLSATGEVQEEFLIQELKRNSLALSSKKRVDEDDYDVFYYFDRVRDTVEEESR